ncbi:transmembrane protein, putative [Medicago truncatula]|uniref:Transmembrane protein, putative n=1 Tax=Medicago truncatula TaxID=3880 RepID=A0A072TQ26_MEDTR|nr:transmembrane protein, putative [Medicago truncatula]
MVSNQPIIRRGGEKLTCTLSEEYANQLIDFMSENPDVPIMLILQLAKFKLYRAIFLKKFLRVWVEPFCLLYVSLIIYCQMVEGFNLFCCLLDVGNGFGKGGCHVGEAKDEIEKLRQECFKAK